VLHQAKGCALAKVNARRWYRTIKTRDLYGAPSAAAAERRLKECAEALEDFAEQVYQTRERP